MSTKLELYKVFKEVAEAGNITAAAQALYISQSAVSQSIKQLENDLQTRLFSRNSRGVSLTAEGQMLFEYVRTAMGLLETGESKLPGPQLDLRIQLQAVLQKELFQIYPGGRLALQQDQREGSDLREGVDMCVLKSVSQTAAAQRFSDFVKSSIAQKA